MLLKDILKAGDLSMRSLQMSKTIKEWTYVLQHTLDQMTDTELKEFEKNNVILYNGQLWGTNERKNNKANRKTSRTNKACCPESKSH